jgi:penicillin-binding protein 2
METISSIKTQSWLSWFLRGVLIFGFLILFARLADLQVIKGEYYRQLAEGNRVRRVPIMASRGRILASNGEELVKNKEIMKRVIFENDEGIKKTDDITGARQEDLLTEWLREYKQVGIYAHITGYLGEVAEDEVGKVKAECTGEGPRIIGTKIGRTGLEEEYDCHLSGVNGEELVEVDSFGNKVRTLGRRDPIPGKDLQTTINARLQEKIAQLMKGKKGAVIVTGKEGEVYALYSNPTYDPNLFVRQGKEEEVSRILNDQANPLFNRAISGRFHPGSVFKPLVAVSALEEGVIDEDFVYEDTGKITIDTLYGSYSYKNWYFTQYGGVEGKIKLPRAIARSTDTFFYKTGELLGIDQLVSWSEKFGLNKKTGIDLPGEVEGLVPSPEWKIKEKGERWFLGNTYHMSIGQGDLAISPAEVNKAISAIAYSGKMCSPHLSNLNFNKEDNCSDLGLNKKTIELVKEGMVAACKPGGTGFTFFDFEEKSGGIKVACKTGTAETGGDSEPHAWFVAFAPYENPEIVVTVLLENAGEGSQEAGPVAREIFNFWFNAEEVPSTTPNNE